MDSGPQVFKTVQEKVRKEDIELKNISKNFEDQQVLKGIDLNIYENEFLTLLGPSGCGKTTLLRIIGGFEEPSNGQLIFDGKDISKVPPYKREVNTVFQKYALFPFLNVADNIAFGLNLKKMDKDVIEKKVSRMLELVGLKGFEKRERNFTFKEVSSRELPQQELLLISLKYC